MEYDAAFFPAPARAALLLNSLQPEPAPAPAADQAPAPATLPAAPAGTAVATTPTARPAPSKADIACADARAVVLRALEALGPLCGGVTKATAELAQQLKAGTAAPDLLAAARVAHQRQRKAQETGVAIGQRTLFTWHTLFAQGGWMALLPAPTAPQALALLAQDVTQVLKNYACSSGAARNLSHVCQEFMRATTGSIQGWRPLYARARRALPKLDQVKLIKARHTGAERAAKLPFKRRKTAAFNPLDICLVDGHTMKCKVRHPDHGQPFAPEVTALIDVSTRKVCGWSVSLSENVIAVGDCIRHGATTHGIWSVYYTDNGPGEANKQLDCNVAGLFARLGAKHVTGRPGHPQGHGLKERAWQTHMIRLASTYGSFQGGSADSGNVRRMRLQIAREKTAIKRAQPGEVVRLTTKVPSWEQFIQDVGEAFARYNAENECRDHPKHEEGPRAGQHLTPDEAWALWLQPEDQHLLDGPYSRLLHMPAKVATAQRGEVALHKKHYFNADLMQVDGQQVRVHFDLHNPAAVWVWSLEGRFICEAGLDANGMDYMPKSFVQMAKEKRAERRVALRLEQADLALAEVGALPLGRKFAGPSMQPTAAGMQFVERLPEQPEQQAPAAEHQAPALAFDGDERPFFDTASDRYEWLQRHPGVWTDADESWLAAYVCSPDYEALAGYYASQGLQWTFPNPTAFKSAG